VIVGVVNIKSMCWYE